MVNAFNEKGNEFIAKQAKDGNKLAKELLETAKKIRDSEDNKVQEGFKQTLRSAISVILIQAGIGLGGAASFKKFGAAASLAGMGLGATAGGCAAKKINEYI